MPIARSKAQQQRAREALDFRLGRTDTASESAQRMSEMNLGDLTELAITDVRAKPERVLKRKKEELKIIEEPQRRTPRITVNGKFPKIKNRIKKIV